MPKAVPVYFALLLSSIASPPAAFADWQYYQDRDPLSGAKYSWASAHASASGSAADYTTAFFCSRKRVKFTLDLNRPNSPRTATFRVFYRVDSKDPAQAELRSYSGDNIGGYSYESAERVARATLGGQTMRLRVLAEDDKQYDAVISLRGSDAAITRVFKDCAIDITQSSRL